MTRAVMLFWLCRNRFALAWTVGAQVALIVAFLVLPTGFDHPSSLGLDFGHLLIGAVLYVAMLIAGLIAAGARRRWPIFGLQIAAPAAAFGLSVLQVMRA
jgi:hypothetical protein